MEACCSLLPGRSIDGRCINFALKMWQHLHADKVRRLDVLVGSTYVFSVLESKLVQMSSQLRQANSASPQQQTLRHKVRQLLVTPMQSLSVAKASPSLASFQSWWTRTIGW